MKKSKINIKDDLKKFWIKYNSFIINGLIPTILFTIIFFSFYPGIMTYDGDFQWKEVQSGLITNSHPFFSTYSMYLLSKIHNTTTIIILYQIILFSLVWGYLCQSLKCSKKQEYIKYIFTIIMCLTPLISIYEITIWKDIMYTSYLFCIGIMLFNFSKNSYEASIVDYIAFGILCMLVFSYRFNGMIVSILIILLLVVILLKKYKIKKVTKNNIKKASVIFVTFIISLSFVIILKNTIINETNKKIEKENKVANKNEVSLSSIYSYILWMMSAHLKNDNIKDENDLEFLNNIIPIEEWKNVYNPYLINNITMAEHLNKQYIVKYNNRFRKIFIKYSKKYPLTIANHYLKSDGMLINPISMIKGYVYAFDFSKWGSFYEKTNSKIPFIQEKYTKLINITLKRPFIIFYQPAFILYIIIILTIILAKKVYGKGIWLFITPMLFNTLSLLPINLAQDLRYVYINYLTFFGILLICAINYKNIFYNKRKLKH